MTDSSNDWCTIESDPGVFTSLIESFGVKNAELSELWSLDDESLLTLTNPMEGVDNVAVHGLIFLFKWQSSNGNGHESKEEAKAEDGNGKPLTGEDVPDGLFFARQVTTNACATQAILSVLFNAANSIVDADGDEEMISSEGGGESKSNNCGDNKEDDQRGRRLVLGSTLSSFKSFTRHFPPDLRGEAIGSSDEIRTAHNSFGRAEDAFLSDPNKPKRIATEDDDVFHFVAYVPYENGDGDEIGVYELDGLKEGPVRVGSYNKSTADAHGGPTQAWVRVARDAIQTRLSHYSAAEIKFNLMAVVQDRRTYLAERLDALASIGVEESDPAMLTVRSELATEEEKRAQWALENERRRYNYLPFCVELLRCLAGSGKMEGLVVKAKDKVQERRKKAEEWKKKMGG